MSAVLMLHADEADCFLTCRLCNLCLKINQEHHFNNLPVSLKIKPCNKSYKVVCIDDRFTRPIVVYRGKNAAYEFIKTILKEYKYCTKIKTNNLIEI